MPQQNLPGFSPPGSVELNNRIRVLRKGDMVTYFLWGDNYFSHNASDKSSERFALASLIDNGHVGVSQVHRGCQIPLRTVNNWLKQYRRRGATSFFRQERPPLPRKITDEVRVRASMALSQGKSVAEAAREAGVEDSTLRKAIKRGAISIDVAQTPAADEPCSSTKSERSVQDAEMAEGMGTACVRADDRVAAALGLLNGAPSRFENCDDVQMGGLLVGLPLLSNNGLFSGLDKYLHMPEGFYSAMHILIILGFMALGRIRRPEGLRHLPPGELGKALGLDRAPEVRTLRNKIDVLAKNGDPAAWRREVGCSWMNESPDEAGYLYIDGHVRVYHGQAANLPRRYVSRDRLCLRGTTDYWINDGLGRPFFVVSKAVTDGLASALLKDFVPTLLEDVPNQPSDEELQEDPLLHRFVMVFDREGATHSLLATLWENRIGAITYRKAVKDEWPPSEFLEYEVPRLGGGTCTMRLAFRQTTLSAADKSIPVSEVRRLRDDGHQTAIISTARTLATVEIASRMFARWCQENYFWYMMEHYDIDGLVEYGATELPGTIEVVNPAWRDLNQQIRRKNAQLQMIQVQAMNAPVENDPEVVRKNAERLQTIEAKKTELQELRTARKALPKKIRIEELPEEKRPTQLSPLRKILTDTVKMIAYRAETSLVAMLRPYLNKEDEARALVRELFVTSADIRPDPKENTLTVRLHRMTCPAHDKAVRALLQQLTETNFIHPQTEMRMIFTLVGTSE